MILVCWRRQEDAQAALRYCKKHGWEVNPLSMKATEPVFDTVYWFRAFDRREATWQLQGVELKGILGLHRVTDREARLDILSRIRP